MSQPDNHHAPRTIQNTWRRDGQPLIIAHRGHSVEHPENTLEAYRRAIELGADMIECDVNITRDGVLVMMHDWTLDRTTNGSGPVEAATWDETQRLDAGSKFGPASAGARVPTAEAALTLFAEAGIYGCLEVKGATPETARRIAGGLAGLLARLDVLETNFLSSYYHEALRAARAYAPVLLAPERLPDDAPPDADEAVRQAQALDAPVLQYQHMVLNGDVVAALHQHDIAVWAWTLNDEAAVIHSLRAGADGLMGDDVRLIVETQGRLKATAAG